MAVLAGAFVVWWGKDHIEATKAGLALLYALQFTDAVKFLVRQHALLEMQMNSVRAGAGAGAGDRPACLPTCLPTCCLPSSNVSAV